MTGVSTPLDQVLELLYRSRTADEIALHFVAPFGVQQRELIARFDAFSDDCHSKTPTETDDSLDDGERLTAVG